MQIGIDVGATKIEHIVLDDNGEESGRSRIDCPQNYSSIIKSKPENVKGSFIKKVTIASTMGIGLQINQASLRWEVQ